MRAATLFTRAQTAGSQGMDSQEWVYAEDVHTRQQAELTAYRKKQKIFRHRLPAGYEKWFEKLPMQEQLYLVSRQADREAEAAAKQLAAQQHGRADKEVEAAASTQVSKVEQAAAPATDIFGLIAAAAEADEVARTEAAQAEAATDIQSVLRMIPYKLALPIRIAVAAAVLTQHQILMTCSEDYCRFLAEPGSFGW